MTDEEWARKLQEEIENEDKDAVLARKLQEKEIKKNRKAENDSTGKRRVPRRSCRSKKVNYSDVLHIAGLSSGSDAEDDTFEDYEESGASGSDGGSDSGSDAYASYDSEHSGSEWKEEHKTHKKPKCKYGKECYQKNPEHRAKFRH